jgi:threonine dehydrogenase-like Zn-dependent dehydrogenase
MSLSCSRTLFPPVGHSAVLANAKSGDSVAIFGSGPVGFLAPHSALIMGAAEVLVVDRPRSVSKARRRSERTVEQGHHHRSGQCAVKKYNAYLRDLIIAGKAKPNFIISYRLPLIQAPGAYDQFDKRGQGSGTPWKAVLKPELDRSRAAHGEDYQR